MGGIAFEDHRSPLDGIRYLGWIRVDDHNIGTLRDEMLPCRAPNATKPAQDHVVVQTGNPLVHTPLVPFPTEKRLEPKLDGCCGSVESGPGAGRNENDGEDLTGSTRIALDLPKPHRAHRDNGHVHGIEGREAFDGHEADAAGNRHQEEDPDTSAEPACRRHELP